MTAFSFTCGVEAPPFTYAQSQWKLKCLACNTYSAWCINHLTGEGNWKKRAIAVKAEIDDIVAAPSTSRKQKGKSSEIDENVDRKKSKGNTYPSFLPLLTCVLDNVEDSTEMSFTTLRSSSIHLLSPISMPPEHASAGNDTTTSHPSKSDVFTNHHVQSSLGLYNQNTLF